MRAVCTEPGEHQMEARKLRRMGGGKEQWGVGGW